MDSNFYISLNVAIFFSALGGAFCFILKREKFILSIVAGFFVHIFAGAAINLIFVFHGGSIALWPLSFSPLILSFGIPGSSGRAEGGQNRKSDWAFAGFLAILICFGVAISSKRFFEACIDYGISIEGAIIFNFILGGIFILFARYFGKKMREVGVKY